RRSALGSLHFAVPLLEWQRRGLVPDTMPQDTQLPATTPVARPVRRHDRLPALVRACSHMEAEEMVACHAHTQIGDHQRVAYLVVAQPVSREPSEALVFR